MQFKKLKTHLNIKILEKLTNITQIMYFPYDFIIIILIILLN